MSFKKILVPVDFSHFSRKSLDVAVNLARCCKGKICLLHVEEDIFHMQQLHKSHPPLENYCEKLHKDFITEKRRCLERFKSYIPGNLFASAAVKEGHAFVEIVKFAKSRRVDLIVMASHGRSGLRHALLGSTTDKVSRKAKCAVLIVKDKARKFISL